MQKKEKNNTLKLIVAVFIIVFLVMSTAAQAVVNTNIENEKQKKEGNQTTISSMTDDNYYTWEDDFNNAQQIDESYSEHFIVENGKVKMYGTYSQWTNPDWTHMKDITIDSSKALDDCVIKLIVEYDSDMKSDYGDLRFKFNSDDYWLPYWIEEKNPIPNDPYAIVWVRIASLPQGDSHVFMFYGNPSATDQGQYWDVFDENSWQKYYTHDHQLTYHMSTEGAWDPDVTWGDNKFLVTWEEGIPKYLPLGMIWRQQIRGCFYNEDGEKIGNRFDITPWDDNPLTTFRCENPASAYGESGSTENFFVAYEYYNTPNDVVSRDIKGAIVPTNTNNINDVSRFNICTSSGNQADPVVAFDDGNNRFFVVWEDGREGTSNYNIYGRFFDLNGNAIGAEKIISNRPNSQVEPWITFDDVNNHYMIVWEEGIHPSNGPFEIWGQLFTVNGDPLGDAKIISQSATSTTDYNFPCVAYCSLTERFLVTWQEDDLSNNDWHGHIWGEILDENCNTVVNTFKIANGEYERTNVVTHLSSSFFVVYDGGGDIWGKLVSSEGDVNPYVLQLSDGESSPADWANIASSGQKIYVAWEDLRILYADPYESLNLPDVFSNVWSFNTPSGSDVSYSFGQEKTLILEAHITSHPISPTNIQSWHEFNAEKTGDVTFDIVDADDPSDILIRDISPGSQINLQETSIRLKAVFNRDNPSSSPSLDKWSVSYVGIDSVPPVTTVDNVQGVKGLNDWYISESVKIWLNSEDYPEDTGSGVYQTYYTLNGGQQQIYNTESGLILSVSQSSDWMGMWDVNFWSVDNSGNEEDKNKDQNKRQIKIDSDKPYVNITSPADEQQLETPFWVRANPTDNAGVDFVEFDIEPFGERPNLPYTDEEPPYEWYCDVEQVSKFIPKAKINTELLNGRPQKTGVSVMVRAQAFDESGQTCIDQVWVHITNWEKTKTINKVYINQKPIVNYLKLDFTLAETLNIQTPVLEDADSARFIATKIFTRRSTEIWDNDLSDGCSVNLDVSSGFYKITTDFYENNKLIEREISARVLFIKT